MGFEGLVGPRVRYADADLPETKKKKKQDKKKEEKEG